MRKATHRLLMLPALLSAATVLGQPTDQNILITDARVLSPSGHALLEGQQVLIGGKRITAVGPDLAEQAPTGTRRLELNGLTLLPGLIDLHTHLLLHPYDEASWNDQVLHESLELRTIRAVTAAQATLQAGFTTIRDLGTEGAGFADVALRDAVELGLIAGPRVVAVTKALVTSGGYGPSGFDPRWEVPKGAQVADGPEGVRKAVREQIAAGADWIKVYADYPRRSGHPATPTFSPVELRAIVDEARSAGLPVAAHATTAEGIRRAVEAGVQTIEHGYGLTEEVAALMADRGVVLCPTLAAAEAMARYSGWEPGQPDHPRIAESKQMFAIALRKGVIVACGSDAGVFAHGDNAREIKLMGEYGMTPRDALQAATITAARVLGRDDVLGRMSNGYIADLIAVRGDPLRETAVLREPAVVFKSGRLIVDRR